MLQVLEITNYALISQLSLEPAQGLNIVTGETGAGKSIILGALGLLMGRRAEGKVHADESKKCSVEATFRIGEYDLEGFFQEMDLDYAEETILRREITPSGRSRAFVNDTPATLEQLRPLAERLIDIHSQHDNLFLGQSDFQTELLDLLAEAQAERQAYARAFQTWKTAQKRLKDLEQKAGESKKEEDYNRFLLQELEDFPLDDYDPDAADAELKRLENADNIREALTTAEQALNHEEAGALPTLRQALQQVQRISEYGQSLADLAQRLDSSLIELQDLAAALEEEALGIATDEERKEELHELTSRFFALQNKHGALSKEELTQIRDRLRSELQETEQLDEHIAEARKNLEAAEAELAQKAGTLTEKRQAGTPAIEEEIKTQLADLGMPHARLKVELSPAEYHKLGQEQVAFRFSANKAGKLQALKAVASGGEFSRLMLCFKYLMARKTALPTIIFDEIDTGISGEIAMKMGRMMARMAQDHQLLIITHMPQIASRSHSHFRVYKETTAEQTYTRLRPLSEEEHVEEIAKMLSGDQPGQAALQNAKELIGME